MLPGPCLVKQVSNPQALPKLRPFCTAGCNGRWVAELCRELPIFYGSPVREVRHCATGAPCTPSKRHVQIAVISWEPQGGRHECSWRTLAACLRESF